MFDYKRAAPTAPAASTANEPVRMDAAAPSPSAAAGVGAGVAAASAGAVVFSSSDCVLVSKLCSYYTQNLTTYAVVVLSHRDTSEEQGECLKSEAHCV